MNHVHTSFVSLLGKCRGIVESFGDIRTFDEWRSVTDVECISILSTRKVVLLK